MEAASWSATDFVDDIPGFKPVHHLAHYEIVLLHFFAIFLVGHVMSWICEDRMQRIPGGLANERLKPNHFHTAICQRVAFFTRIDLHAAISQIASSSHQYCAVSRQ